MLTFFEYMIKISSKSNLASYLTSKEKNMNVDTKFLVEKTKITDQSIEFADLFFV